MVLELSLRQRPIEPKRRRRSEAATVAGRIDTFNFFAGKTSPPFSFPSMDLTPLLLFLSEQARGGRLSAEEKGAIKERALGGNSQVHHRLQA